MNADNVLRLLMIVSLAFSAPMGAKEVDLTRDYSFIGICKVVRGKLDGKVVAVFKPVKVFHHDRVERKHAFYMGESYLVKEGELVALVIGRGERGEKRVRSVSKKSKDPVVISIDREPYRASEVQRMLENNLNEVGP